MNNKKPIYLHLKTEFSFLNSAIRLNKLFNLIESQKIEYLAITDKENLYALPYLLEFREKYKFKLIIGCEFELDNKLEVIILAKNLAGYKLINELIYQKSNNNSINLSDLNSENIFVIDSDTNGYLKNKKSLEVELPNFFYNSKFQLENKDNVVYAPVKKIIDKFENFTLNILDKIREEFKENNNFDDFYSEEEFNDLDEKIYQNTLNLADQCFELEIDKEIKLPEFSSNSKEEIESKIKASERTKYLLLNYDKDLVIERINYELSIIKEQNFVDYFLIIADALSWARKNKISIGPGRGSVSGSLVAYVLEITDVNPLDFDLLFERFLNTKRVTYPDIDIDIQDDRRSEVLDYIFEKYGQKRCALITTFSTLGAKSAIKDVGRMLGISNSEVNLVTKTINDFDKNLTLESEYNKRNSKYKAIVSKYENLHEYATYIEGLYRQTGVHAAGIVIANNDITNYFPINKVLDKYNQVQLSLENLEKYGLIKIDFLGLKNLTIVKNIENLINSKLHFDNVINQNLNKFIDHKTFSILNDLKTEGIFQLESDGMKRAISQVKIDSFEDIYAIISLYRPGPSQYIPIYGKNKKDPSQIEKVHPIYDKIVAPTFGIIVYQEQIMQIAQEVAGLSFSEADLLRRAISKKNSQELKSYKTKFFEGGAKNNVSSDLLNRIYSNIEKFADYGFNKSHAVAYAVLALKLAFYKARYPFIFYKVLLDNSFSSQENTSKYVQEATKLKIKINAADINISSLNTVEENNNLYLSFLTIKGFGENSATKLIQERNRAGKFKNFFDVAIRLGMIGIKKATLSLLINANIFRSFGNINTLINSLEDVSNFVDLINKKVKKAFMTLDKSEQTDGKWISLYEDFAREEQFPNILDEVEISDKEIMDLETKAYGISLSVIDESKVENEFSLNSLNENETRNFNVILEEFDVKLNTNSKKVKINDGKVSKFAFVSDYSLSIFNKELLNKKINVTVTLKKSRSNFKYLLLEKWSL